MRNIFLAVTVTLVLGPIGARAHSVNDADSKIDAVGAKLNGSWKFLGSSEPETGKRDLAPVMSASADVHMTPTPLVAHTLVTLGLDDMRAPAISLAPEPSVAAALPAPSVEKSLKKLFCVEYARAVSGLAIFGDAKFWWGKAKDLYARTSHPLQEAVMVFSSSARLKRGHVAVVTDIVSAREIRVEQANWMNKGEIDHSTPVLDVSTKNDWSKVRVWDMPSHQFGSRIYTISGFILKPDVRQASND
jgi:hypothetical protein